VGVAWGLVLDWGANGKVRFVQGRPWIRSGTSWPEAPAVSVLLGSPPRQAFIQEHGDTVGGGGFLLAGGFSGWPWPSMIAYTAQSPAGMREVLWRVRVGNRTADLPMEPVWPGFALDTAMYGSLVFLLWSGPRLVRRRVRKRRGRCVGCGYDLKGNVWGGVCPECGR
jgi:hypothetical protein